MFTINLRAEFHAPDSDASLVITIKLCNSHFVVLHFSESYLNKCYLFFKDLLPRSFQDTRLIGASAASSCVYHVGNGYCRNLKCTTFV